MTHSIIEIIDEDVIDLELFQKSNMLDEDFSWHADECDLSITDFIDMDDEIQVTEEDSNKKVLPTRWSSILFAISILKNNEWARSSSLWRNSEVNRNLIRNSFRVANKRI